LTAEPLANLDKSTLRERALQALRSAITSGQYSPGQHLGEVELATSLGISRGTVREALRHLEQEGLVTAGHRGMLRVNQLSAEEIRGLYGVRAALEGLAVRTIIGSPHRDQAVAKLRSAVSGLSDDRADFSRRVESDLAFHLLLCELAGNPMLVESWKHLEGRIRVAIMSHNPEELPDIMSRDRHSPIVDAIEAGDVPAAQAIVDQHMQVAAELYAAG
jgi:DNA-binding GntR family transcriptional regulator